MFKEWKIRRIRDQKNETWYFSVVDIVSILSGSLDWRNYRKVLKNRLKHEWSEVVTKCNQLKLLAEDGKFRKTTEISQQENPSWFEENKNIAKRWWSVAFEARKKLEQESKRKVISDQKKLNCK